MTSRDGLENQVNQGSNDVCANRDRASVISRDENGKQERYEISTRNGDGQTQHVEDLTVETTQEQNIAVDPQYYEYLENESWKYEKIRKAVEENPEIARRIRIISDNDDQEWNVEVFESEEQAYAEKEKYDKYNEGERPKEKHRFFDDAREFLLTLQESLQQIFQKPDSDQTIKWSDTVVTPGIDANYKSFDASLKIRSEQKCNRDIVSFAEATYTNGASAIEKAEKCAEEIIKIHRQNGKQSTPAVNNLGTTTTLAIANEIKSITKKDEVWSLGATTRLKQKIPEQLQDELHEHAKGESKFLWIVQILIEAKIALGANTTDDAKKLDAIVKAGPKLGTANNNPDILDNIRVYRKAVEDLNARGQLQPAIAFQAVLDEYEMFSERLPILNRQETTTRFGELRKPMYAQTEDTLQALRFIKESVEETTVKPPEDCPHFLGNGCRFGDKCKYFHDPSKKKSKQSDGKPKGTKGDDKGYKGWKEDNKGKDKGKGKQGKGWQQKSWKDWQEKHRNDDNKGTKSKGKGFTFDDCRKWMKGESCDGKCGKKHDETKKGINSKKFCTNGPKCTYGDRCAFVHNKAAIQEELD